MLIEPKKEYEGYRNYEIRNYIEFSGRNFSFDLSFNLILEVNKILQGGNIFKIRIELPGITPSKYTNVQNLNELKELLYSFKDYDEYAIAFIKENSLSGDNEIADFGLYYMKNSDINFTIQGYCKDHLQEFYEFFSNLQFFKDNNIDFLKMSMINPKLDDFVETYFRKLYNETGKLEYRDVANGDFTVCSGINWTCIKAPHVKNYRGFYVTKTFGKLPLCPFGNFDFLDELPLFKLTRFNNGAIWLQLTEDVCPWDDDPAYIQALHTFVDAYIEKRDEYFYSLPIEVQNEMLGNLKPNS